MRTLSTLAFITTLSWSFTLLADDGPTARDTQEATRAFKTGQSLFEEGAYLEAAEAFKRAYRFVSHPAVLANIGFCYRAAGDHPRAVEFFRKYLREPSPQTPKKNAEIRAYLKKTKSKVGDLEVTCSEARCEVTVDNVSRGLAPATIVLLAGEHSVDVAKIDGEQVRRYEVIVPAGGRLELDVNLSSSQSSPEELSAKKLPPLGPSKEPLRLRAPFWIATGMTVAGAGAVAVLGGLSNKVLDDFESGGSTDTALKERGENLTLGANLAIGVTAASAAAAVIFAFVDLKRDPNEDKSLTGAGQGTKLRLRLTYGAAFFGVRGTF